MIMAITTAPKSNPFPKRRTTYCHPERLQPYSLKPMQLENPSHSPGIPILSLPLSICLSGLQPSVLPCAMYPSYQHFYN